MQIVVSEKGGAKIMALSGRLDAVTVGEAEHQLNTLIESGQSIVVIDFETLEYISSAGLRFVLAGAKKLQARNGKLLLAGLGGVVKEVFELAGFYDLLPVFDTPDQAIGSL
ncbi:MAG: STAS domain-containing protein [Proteobacteria bacterium]|nr:STAS domain-containing protein [Pseudomonadota bacterium]